MTETARRPRILTAVDYYLPAQRSGGPVRAIAAIVERLGDEFAFRIATRDRDVASTMPFDDVRIDEWQPLGKGDVRYLSPARLGLVSLARLLRADRHEALYLTSLFGAFTWRVLLLRVLGVARAPTIVAPKGELAPGAIGAKGARKRAYLLALRAIGALDGIVWQATNDTEADEVRRHIGARADVVVAGELPPPLPDVAPRPSKQPGTLRIAFASRIVPKKNLVGALRLLAGLDGRVEFDVYGNLEDAAYVGECRRVAATLPANVRVRFHGHVDHGALDAVLSQHDVMLFPTHGENFGYIVLEALANGCPVLLSDRTPWRGLEEARAGWALSLADEDRMRYTLQQLVAMDDDAHRALRAGARAYAERARADESSVADNRALFRRVAR